MEDTDRKSAIARRAYYKGAITKQKAKLQQENLDLASAEMLKLKEAKLVKIYGEYEELCIQLDEDEDDATEEAYLECMERVRIAMNRLNKPQSGSSCSSSKVKLPDVSLPIFDGNYLEYGPFKEMFDAMIDSDPDIQDIQKLFYLRSYLRGEALDLIKNMPVVGSSYKESLNILDDRYNNKAKIVFQHILQLLDIKPISKPNVQCLRTLISEAKQHVAALKNLGQPVEHWDAFLVCILSRKLDQLNSRAFYLEQSSPSVPTYTNFIKFLEARALALESSNVRDNTVKDREVNMRAGSTLQVSQAKTTHVAVDASCNFCGPQRNATNNHSEETVALLSGKNNCSQVLLPYAKVELVSRGGSKIIVKALLDSASQSSFITSKLAKQLGKPLVPNKTGVIGIANTSKTISQAITTEVYSCAYPYKVFVNCLVTDAITAKLPQCGFSLADLNIPNNIKLADDTCNDPSEIDILLGADIFFQTLLPQSEELTRHHRDAAQPRLVHTQFGYILAGNLPEFSHGNSAVSLFCRDCKTDLNSTMKQFWQSESVPQEFTEHESEKVQCEEHFQKTVKLENKQFEVSIPLKVPIYDINNYIGDSLSLALKRFLNLEKKLHNDPSLFKEYKSFIDEYIDLGHASSVDISQYDLNKDPIYFIPHHAVLKPDAVSTKLRVVMDAGMKGSNKMSLNDLMLTGPVIQADMFDILLRFRVHKYFFLCDIRRMYRNILITPEQRSLQNILWRDSPQEPISCLQLQTVSYGLRSSSFLATRCLYELAIRYKDEFPLGSKAILQSSYVDDIVQSHNDLDTIINIKRQLIDLLSLGSFNLHKWCANNSAILSDIPTEKQQHSDELEFQKEIKTLGLKFNVNNDSFQFAPMLEQPATTKRQILSFISQFFDPLGLAGPLFVQAKEIMQSLWISKVGWDSAPPPEILTKWQEFYSSLTRMQPLTIKRNVCLDNQTNAELVGFSDSSAKAYGCAIYLRATDKNDQNPADCLSRGVNPCDLMQHPLWFNGPKFMLDPDYKFTEFNYEAVKCNLPEVKVVSEQNITDLPENRLKFWQKCTALTQQFWRHWSKHYLNNLQNRPKWKQSLPNVKVGDLVILKETETPPMTWPMARVTQRTTNDPPPPATMSSGPRLVHKQFNSPIGLYSQQNIKETLSKHIQDLGNGTVGLESLDMEKKSKWNMVELQTARAPVCRRHGPHASCSQLQPAPTRKL
ncbi:unnamed protein product [Plutella xylostella]|uniref:(diamondback moth) hypothetical protein n=1 Tax=Plutella xylostella TaxID=51655 RepID=A0A8S4GD89_PLUXY|nr:unnamed protein product [Plutella xylostella]